MIEGIYRSILTSTFKDHAKTSKTEEHGPQLLLVHIKDRFGSQSTSASMIANDI